jgi:hypothetical protein
MIYFDPESPDWLRSWVDSVCDGSFTPIYRASVSASDLREDLDAVIPRKSRTLITTNLDNDDGLGLDFVARARRFVPEAQRTALYFGRGLVLAGPRLFLRTDRANAFCSVVESWEEPVTCWSDWHNRLYRTMPTAVLLGEPQWLQVVHGTNVSNRPRGRLVSPGRYAQSFLGLDDGPEPTLGALRADRLLFSPGRKARDATRSSARRIAVATLGKDGLNRAKESLASKRHALSCAERAG